MHWLPMAFSSLSHLPMAIDRTALHPMARHCCDGQTCPIASNTLVWAARQTLQSPRYRDGDRLEMVCEASFKGHSRRYGPKRQASRSLEAASWPRQGVVQRFARPLASARHRALRLASYPCISHRARNHYSPVTQANNSHSRSAT